jgi:hypothetical protein
VNEAPTAIKINGTQALENSVPGTLVSFIEVKDPDEPLVAQRFSCKLRNDAGGRFQINGLKLVVGKSNVLDYESPWGSKCLIDIECQDQDGESVNKQFVIEIVNVNERPTGISSINGKFEVYQYNIAILF